MNASKTIVPARDLFDDYLRSCKKRRTAERFAILEQVELLHGHFTADNLCELMRNAGYPVSVATVYSTLELLVGCGLVVRQRFEGKASCYERAPRHEQPHHHLVCTQCGKIKEVKDPAVAELVAAKRFAGFSQRWYSLTIYGVCGTCARKKKKT